MIEVKNAHLLDQIDWDTEIKDPKEASLTETQKEKKLCEALYFWTSIKTYVKVETLEDTKENGIRMLQYAYAKFLYYSRLFYEDNHGSLLDIKKAIKEYKGHFLNDFKKKYPDLKRSKIPLKQITDLEKVLLKHYRDQVKKKKEAIDLKAEYNEVKTLFENEGFKVSKPKGLKKESDRDTVCTIHKGVRFHLSLTKPRIWGEDRTSEFVKRKAEDHKEMIRRYFPLVEKIYDKMKQFPGVGTVWAMEGGGMQHQVFFGNEKGYLAILYLDMKGEDSTREKYTLDVQWEGNNKFFEEFEVEGVKVDLADFVKS